MGITTSAKALVLWPFPSHLTPPSPPNVSSLELSAVIPMSAIAKRIIIYETVMKTFLEYSANFYIDIDIRIYRALSPKRVFRFIRSSNI